MRNDLRSGASEGFDEIKLSLRSEIGRIRGEIVNALAGLLANPDPNIRCNALVDLGAFIEHAESATPQLTARLQDESPTNRKYAAQILGKMGAKSASTVSALVEALNDRDLHVRKAAAIALGQIGEPSPQAVEMLIRTLSDVEPSVREASVRALGKLGGKGAEVVEVLLRALADDEDIDVRLAAVGALGEVGPGAQAAINELHRLTQNYELGSLSHAAGIALKRIR